MGLRIQSDRWDITLEGANRASVWERRASDQIPRLRIKTDNRDHLVEVNADTATERPVGRVYDGIGVRLLEETNYRLSVVSRRGKTPQVTHLDPSLVRDVRPIPGHPDVISGNINFRSQVGDSRFVIADGESTIQFWVEVRPSKLDYETDYEDLLHSVAGLARQLVLEFLRATTRGASTQTAGDTRQIEWLLLLREEISSLERALTYITGCPHRQLSSKDQIVPAERIRRASPDTRRAIARGGGEGAWAIAEGLGYHRAKLPASQPREVLGSPENRWLKSQIERVITALVKLRQDFESSQRRWQGRNSSVRTTAVVKELVDMEATLKPFLTMSPFVDVPSWVGHSYTSLVLQGRSGYREANQALLRLNMSLIVGGEAVDIPVRDLSELYEVWCFLSVVHQVSQVLGAEIDVFDLIELRDTGVRLTVVPGVQSTVKVTALDCEARVTYNREYRMRSGPQRPDIVIEVLREDMPPVLLLLDAKYRLDTTPDYVNVFGCPGPPPDAIGQLHRYRDAITVKYPKYGRGRPVVRAVALFPLGENDSRDWVRHPYFEAIEEVGIGGLPFLPSNTAWVNEWLDQGIKAPPSRLAWPGPDFIAWSQVGRSHVSP